MLQFNLNGIQETHILHCSSCGNDDRFVQVVSYETHLVDRNLVHLHLLDSDIERYDCYSCGAEVQPIWAQQSK